MIGPQTETLVGQRNRLLLSLGYDFLAGRSELVAICTDSLTSTPDFVLKGIIRHSMADQYDRDRLVFGSEHNAKLLKKWPRQKQKNQTVFCAVKHRRCHDRAICDRQMNEVIERSLVKVKRYPRPSDLEVLEHSLRVGTARDLLDKGHEMTTII